MEIFYSLFAACAAMLGVFAVLKFYKWVENNSFLIINFVAGMILTITFVHLIPEGFSLNPKVMMYVFYGFLTTFCLQYCNKYFEYIKITSVFGLSLHSVIDGLIIAIGFRSDSKLAVLTTLAILLHKLPDGITISGILLHNGASKRKILNFSLITSCFTPIGTIIGMFIFKNMSMIALGSLLGITSGSLIFLAASDLIPEAYKSNNKLAFLMLFVGVIITIIAEYFI
ncbi:MAG: ZIP family metal transporter [Endomicrobium sp.]|jgi:ZIP family zinc transporter/zinc and cadmium transporter|nr:ZIP family metal transporter [Endomicrobium sp.]